MCGRMYLDRENKDLYDSVALLDNPELAPELSWGEVRPSECVPVIAARGFSPLIVAARWGYTNDRGQTTLINARAETAAVRRTFASDLAARRCLVPVSGYFEWTAEPDKKKCLFFDQGGDILFLAGLWRKEWVSGDYRFVILTTGADGAEADVHPRRPLLVSAEEAETWLFDPSGAKALLEADMPPLAYIRMPAGVCIG
ncbi:MAG: SOS response-associated peptidase family protein [Clostridia bacterium]|nr:SOS response-associated peptidase family protein [Clostridia bacterium]